MKYFSPIHVAICVVVQQEAQAKAVDLNSNLLHFILCGKNAMKKVENHTWSTVAGGGN